MEEHEYDPKNATTCKACKKLYDKYGDTDAQLEDYHEIEPITSNKRKRDDDDSRYDVPSSDSRYDVPSPDSRYDLPGEDIKNANEFGDSSRNVRLKKEYTGKVAAPASQMDAFEFYGGKRRRSHRRRRTHKKSHKKTS